MRTMLYLTTRQDAATWDFVEAEARGAGLDARRAIARPEASDSVFAEALAAADAIILDSAGLDAARIAAAGRCQIIVHAGPSGGGTDLEAARAAGIPVVSIPDAATERIAARVLAVVRSALPAPGQGSARPPRPPRLGLIGLGRVGRTLARLAGELRWDVWACDPFVHRETFHQAHVRPAPLLDLLGLADAVSIHVPRCAATCPLLDRFALDALRPGAPLINASHRDVLDARWNGRRVEIATRFEDDPGIIRASLAAAIEIVRAYFAGAEPDHLLIDPAFPRALRSGSI